MPRIDSNHSPRGKRPFHFLIWKKTIATSILPMRNARQRHHTIDPSPQQPSISKTASSHCSTRYHSSPNLTSPSSTPLCYRREAVNSTHRSKQGGGKVGLNNTSPHRTLTHSPTCLPSSLHDTFSLHGSITASNRLSLGLHMRFA